MKVTRQQLELYLSQYVTSEDRAKPDIVRAVQLGHAMGMLMELLEDGADARRQRERFAAWQERLRAEAPLLNSETVMSGRLNEEQTP